LKRRGLHTPVAGVLCYHCGEGAASAVSPYRGLFGVGRE
jgi:hypothetical protein